MEADRLKRSLLGYTTIPAAAVRLRRIVQRVLIYAGLAAGSVIYALPFLWMVSTSLKDPRMAMQYPPSWWPDPIVWENYVRSVTILPFDHFTVNSVLYTGFALVGHLVSCSVVAYGFARIPFRGRGVLFVVLLSTLMLPWQVTLIPQFILFKNLGWLDTLLPLVVPTYFGNAFYIFLLRQFLMTLPLELDEAARIDGANPFQTFLLVNLPLLKPALATVAIFAFIYHWNDFFGPLIYLTTPEQMTIAVGLQLFRGQYGTDFTLLMAASTLALLPIIILFFFTQRTFVQGIALTGIKG
jgi:ABC-type glycerol-3-phosphate transport system permease component